MMQIEKLILTTYHEYWEAPHAAANPLSTPPAAVYNTIQSLIQIQPHPDVGYATQIAIQIRAFIKTKITFFLWIDATLK